MNVKCTSCGNVTTISWLPAYCSKCQGSYAEIAPAPDPTYRVSVWMDGGCRNNGSPEAEGYCSVRVAGRRSEDTLYSIDLAEAKTNNQAEYGALLCTLDLIDVLRITAQTRPVELTLHTDSKLLIGQVSGEFRIKNQRLAYLRAAAIDGLALLRKAGVQVKFLWVPRETIVAKLGH